MIIRNLSKYRFGMDASKVKDLRKNLGTVYPFGGPTRVIVEPSLWDWNMDFKEYQPPIFTIPQILKGDKPWADPEIGAAGFSPKFNAVDEKGLNRGSYEGQIQVNEDGYPLNPVGRTGLGGRGSLGKWGPNHAADCIVTRWKKNEEGKILRNGDNPPILEFVAIRRQDSGELAIPGGMVEPGEDPLDAAKREFVEEVIGIDDINDVDPTLKEDLNKIFEQHKIIDKCYVDDRRNTDNAWIETCAVNFNISQSLSIFDKMKFKSGSDAKEAFWIEYTSDMNLYASHGDLMRKAVSILYEQ